MMIQTKYFRNTATTVVVRCGCGQTIIHDLKRATIRCYTCGSKQSFEAALEELLIHEQRQDSPILPERELLAG